MNDSLLGLLNSKSKVCNVRLRTWGTWVNFVIQNSFTDFHSNTALSSRGRAKLRAFPCYCTVENTQLSPSLTRKPCKLFRNGWLLIWKSQFFEDSSSQLNKTLVGPYPLGAIWAISGPLIIRLPLAVIMSWYQRPLFAAPRHAMPLTQLLLPPHLPCAHPHNGTQALDGK